MNRKILSIFAAVLAVVFVSCNNGNDINESNKGSFDSTTETLKTSVSETSKNPYAFLGEMHNKGLKEGLKAFYYSDLNREDVSEKEITDFVSQFTVDFVTQEIVRLENVEDEAALRQSLQESIGNSNFQWCAIASLEDVKSEIEKSKLTDFQKENLKMLMKIISTNDDALSEKLETFENEILDSKVSDEEKMPVLAVSAISRSSLEFWTEHVVSINGYRGGANVIVKENGDIFLVVESGSKTALNIFGADAAGAVGGIIGGVIGGHAAAGLMFGPGGIVLTLAGDAVLGAISGSITGGIGAMLKKWF